MPVEMTGHLGGNDNEGVPEKAGDTVIETIHGVEKEALLLRESLLTPS